MKKGKKDFKSYVNLLSQKESYTKIYANKSDKKLKFDFIGGSKKHSLRTLKRYAKKNKVDVQDIILFTFIYDLSVYSGTNDILFLGDINKEQYPFYLDINTNDISKLLTKVKETKELIQEYSDELLSIQDKILEKDNIISLSFNNKDNDYDLNFNIKLGLTVNLKIKYNSSKYTERLIKNIYDSFYIILDSITKCENVNDINYLTDIDIELLKEVNNTEVLIDEDNIPSMFKKQVLKNKDRIAVADCNNKNTYLELDKNTNKIANELLKNNIKAEDIVMVMLNRSYYSPIARIGIIKGTGAFLNVLPDYPLDRIKYILEDTKAKFIITTKIIYNERFDLFNDYKGKVLFIEDVLENGNDDEVTVKNSGKYLCYTIFTSGSTGKPKGVQIEQRNLINYCHVNKYNYEAKAVSQNINASIALASQTFDVSILEEFIPLLNGGTVVVANEEEIFNPLKLAKLIKDNNIEAVTCTPSFINSIIDIDEIKDSMKDFKVFNIGAEAFPQGLYKRLKDINKKAKVYNGYGPTEATIGCTFKELKSDVNITIGKPMANTEIYMVNKNHKILPIDVPGELAILSNGVSRGYLNLPKLNKERFVKIKGKKAYLSGDLAKWDTNGEIEFLGRIDNQIKINGYRIELSEIEEVVNSYEGVKNCVAKVIENDSEKYICAYFIAEKQIDLNDLKSFVSKYVPEYMVPKKMMQLAEFPLNTNGKVDRKQLPIPGDDEKNYVEPINELENKLCEIIKTVLKKDKVSTTDSFFNIGGNSLNVMKLITQANNNGITIEYKDVFNYPVIKDLATYLIKKDKKEEETIIDFDKVNEIIKNNTLSELIKNKEKHAKKLNNIIISGGTGFLGIHVIYELLRSDDYKDSKVYTLIRKGKFDSLEDRINYLFDYYFNESIDNYKDRLVLVEGDITDKESFKKLEEFKADAFINCAAMVKYYDSNNQIEKVNVQGVKNIIKYCQDNNIMLVQISTTSVGGTKNLKDNNYKFGENILYFGQNLENKYAKTKFEAEECIIEAIPNGLNAKIIRVGNLMPRYKDYQFQINYNDNGFMNMLKAFVILKCIPMSLFIQNIELSPVDNTAKSILKIINNDDKFNLYHSFNNNSIYYYDIVHAMNEYGFNIKVVSDEEFNKILDDKINNSDNVEQFIGLYADLASDSKKELQEVDAKNDFTTELLYSLGFKWPNITSDYLKNVFKKLDDLKYFNEQM